MLKINMLKLFLNTGYKIKTFKKFQLVVADVFVCSSAEMGMFIKIDGCPPNGDLGIFFCLVARNN